MTMTVRQLAEATGATMTRAALWMAPLLAVMHRNDISTVKRRAAFLSQIGHESAGLTAVVENFNYKPEALLRTFNTRTRRRFTPEQAQLYGRTAEHPANQQMIANLAYANRMGNGPPESGDGWRYRARGPGQLTGKNNYTACGAALGLDLVNDPDLLLRRDYGSQAFGWYWSTGNPTGKSLNLLADQDDWYGICGAVNGGENGLADRLALIENNLVILA